MGGGAASGAMAGGERERSKQARASEGRRSAPPSRSESGAADGRRGRLRSIMQRVRPRVLGGSGAARTRHEARGVCHVPPELVHTHTHRGTSPSWERQVASGLIARRARAIVSEFGAPAPICVRRVMAVCPMCGAVAAVSGVVCRVSAARACSAHGPARCAHRPPWCPVCAVTCHSVRCLCGCVTSAERFRRVGVDTSSSKVRSSFRRSEVRDRGASACAALHSSSFGTTSFAWRTVCGTEGSGGDWPSGRACAGGAGEHSLHHINCLSAFWVV